MIQKLEIETEKPRKQYLKNKFQRIDEYDKDEVQNLIIVVISKIYLLSGIKGVIPKTDKQDILKMILKRFKHLSLEDIYIAFELERYNEYEQKTEHFQLFNADYVSQILNKFLNWKKNKKTEWQIKNDTNVLQIDKEVNNDEYHQIILDEIKAYGITRKANVYYRHMAELGLFKRYSQKQYFEAKENIRQNLLNQKKKSEVRSDRIWAKFNANVHKIDKVELMVRDFFVSRLIADTEPGKRKELLRKLDTIMDEKEKAKIQKQKNND